MEGRRVPKDKGADNPTIAEIRDVCQALGLTATLEVFIHNQSPTPPHPHPTPPPHKPYW